MRYTLLLAALLAVLIGCGQPVDPDSNLPVLAPGEKHSRLGGAEGVWVAARESGGREADLAVIYRDGTRLPADAPQLSWASRYSDGLGWKGLPAFKPGDYPVVLFGRDDVFVAARRARDGSIPPAAPR
jgi:hypothetical protein